jgi:hypothetical protein
MRKLPERLTYANVMATIAVFIALGGTGYAALKLPKNSVGTKQIKNGAVTGKKVAAHTLTGNNLNLASLGTVPSATNASTAQNAGHATSADSAGKAAHATTADVASEVETLGGFVAECPEGTVLIRGICFDASPNGPVSSVTAAADGCAGRGGYLPTPMELFSTRGVLNLGSGLGSERQYTDSYYDNTTGASYSTILVDGTGGLTRVAVEGVSAHYICAYTLLG